MSVLTAWPDQESAEYAHRLGCPQRRDRRVEAPSLCVRIRGRDYTTVNWSLSGILITGYDGVLNVGDQFEIEALQSRRGVPWPVTILAQVVRRGQGEGTDLAAQFVVVDPAAFDILEGIMMRKARYRRVA